MAIKPRTTKNDLFYESLIHSYVGAPRFVERSWLERRVLGALDEPNCRFVLLTAEPGAGKTAFMAWLARRNSVWPRYFIRRDSRTPLSSGDARSFLFTLGHQVAACQPDLFPSDRVEVIVEQEADRLQAGARMTAVEVGILLASPFRHTAVKVKQKARLVAGEMLGLSVKRMAIEPRLLELGNLHHLALTDPARHLAKQDPEARIVVLVDALDELRYHPGGDDILDWLAVCPELPANVHIVLTSRPDDALLARFRSSQKPWLSEMSINLKSDRVKKDTREYAEHFADQEAVREALERHSVSPYQFVSEAVGRADGNFQYLTTLFRGIEQAMKRAPVETAQAKLLGSLFGLENVPDELGALYAFFLTLIRDTVADYDVEVRGAWPLKWHYQPAWEGLYQPLLGILSVAREPLNRGQMLALSRASSEARWICGAINRLAQFLDQQNGHFRLYHASLPEFLTHEQTWTTHPDCYLNPQEWHRKIVGHYLDTYSEDWSECDAYGLTYLVGHIVAAGLERSDLEAVLDQTLTIDFMKAVYDRFGWLYSFVEDLEVLTSVDPKRAVELCLQVMLDVGMPNSLVNQKALQLVVDQRPTTGEIGNRKSSRHKTINRVAAILAEKPSEAADDLLIELKKARKRVRSTILLALGEVGGEKAREALLDEFKYAVRKFGRDGYAYSWAAAEGLLSLNDDSIAVELKAWYWKTKSLADKERVLYVLGWMRAEEARALLPDALKLSRAKAVGRAVDLMWLLEPAEGDVHFLLKKLKEIVESPPREPKKLGTWKDEWLQKRLVRTLHKLGVTKAVLDLQRLSTHVTARGRPKDVVKRDNLIESLEDAICDLDSGSSEGA